MQRGVRAATLGARLCFADIVGSDIVDGLLTERRHFSNAHGVTVFKEMTMRTKIVALLMISLFVAVNVIASTYAEAAGNGSGSGGNPFNCKNKPDQPKCKKK